MINKEGKTAEQKQRGRVEAGDEIASKRLKMRRIMLGMSQQDLANAASVSIQQIQKYENAINRISSGKLHALAKIMQIPVNYFFGSDDNNPIVFLEQESEQKKKPGTSDYDKEIVEFIKAFKTVKDTQSRKKILALIKIMVS